MSSKVKFHIYLIEEGRIEYDPKGIILRRFRIFPCILNKPEERSLRSMYCWFAHGFKISQDVTLLMVHVTVKRDNLWTLMNILNTNYWKA
jgi:hypothetical protein